MKMCLLIFTLFLAGCSLPNLAITQQSVEQALGQDNLNTIKSQSYTLDGSFCAKMVNGKYIKMTLREALTLAYKDGCLKDKTIEKLAPNQKGATVFCGESSGNWGFRLEAKERGDVSVCSVDIVNKTVGTGYYEPLQGGYKVPGT